MVLGASPDTPGNKSFSCFITIIISTCLRSWSRLKRLLSIGVMICITYLRFQTRFDWEDTLDRLIKSLDLLDIGNGMMAWCLLNAHWGAPIGSHILLPHTESKIPMGFDYKLMEKKLRVCLMSLMSNSCKQQTAMSLCFDTSTQYVFDVEHVLAKHTSFGDPDISYKNGSEWCRYSFKEQPGLAIYYNHNSDESVLSLPAGTAYEEQF